MTIHKHRLCITMGDHAITTHERSKVLHVGLDPSGEPCIWLQVDTSQPFMHFGVFIIGTGHDVPREAVHHIGSFLDGEFMWHIYIENHPWLTP